MSDRDPGLSFYTMPSQVSPPPSPYLEARIASLETNAGHVLGDIDALTEKYHELLFDLDKIKQLVGWPADPSRDQPPSPSHLRALEFSQELEELTRDVHKSVDGADVEKVNGTTTPKANATMPPHMRAAAGATNGATSKAIPPHLRGKVAGR